MRKIRENSFEIIDNRVEVIQYSVCIALMR